MTGLVPAALRLDLKDYITNVTVFYHNATGYLKINEK